MKALLSNDDGITASGILASKKAMEEITDVTIVAPETQQSGIGHALTLYNPLRVNEIVLRDGSSGYAVSGTPSDSITLGVFEIMDEKPDIVVSGINTGFNLGKTELTTSGTIGAAIEASSYGIPTIAISQEVTVDSVKFEKGQIAVDFTFAQKILKKVAKRVLEKGMPDNVDILNINVPANPVSDEIKIARLGTRMYMPDVEKRQDPRGKPYYWIGGTLFDEKEENTDSYILRKEHYTTITPITLDATGNLKSMKKWIE